MGISVYEEHTPLGCTKAGPAQLNRVPSGKFNRACPAVLSRHSFNEGGSLCEGGSFGPGCLLESLKLGFLSWLEVIGCGILHTALKLTIVPKVPKMPRVH
jgi:hypothetical protein